MGDSHFPISGSWFHFLKHSPKTCAGMIGQKGISELTCKVATEVPMGTKFRAMATCQYAGPC